MKYISKLCNIYGCSEKKFWCEVTDTQTKTTTRYNLQEFVKFCQEGFLNIKDFAVSGLILDPEGYPTGVYLSSGNPEVITPETIEETKKLSNRDRAIGNGSNDLFCIQGGMILGSQDFYLSEVGNKISYVYNESFKVRDLSFYMIVQEIKNVSKLNDTLAFEIPDGVNSFRFSPKLSKESRQYWRDAICKIEAPDTLQEFQTGVLSGMSWLSGVNFRTSPVKLSGQFFKGCLNLVSVVLPDDLTTIKSKLFIGCPRLEHIYFPVGLQYITGEFKILDDKVKENANMGVSLHFAYGCKANIADFIRQNCNSIRDVYCDLQFYLINRRVFEECGVEINIKVEGVLKR